MSKETKVFSVEGMSCSHCENSIKKSVGAMAGVSSVVVDLEHKKVTVEFEGEKATSDAIRETIEDQGYDVIA